MPKIVDAARQRPPKSEMVALLPRWAQAAFAYRCAARVRPLVDLINVEAVQLRALDAALSWTATSARNAKVGDDGPNVCDKAKKAHNALAFADPSGRVSAAAMSIVSAAACASDGEPDYFGAVKSNVAAANAASIAAGGTDGLFPLHDSFSPSRHRVPRRSLEIVWSMWHDFDFLFRLTKEEAWHNESPVDPDICGPLWQWSANGGLGISVKTTQTLPVMQVDLVVPSGMNAAESTEFARRVAMFYAELSRLHVSMGGTGLRILDEGSCALAPAEDEMPGPVESPIEAVGAGATA